ncbi:hypothetical protein CK203_085649 [Vitis vinifera]|uniref:Uncharacterized protein n=1 Tax=Vitis vinifera TaxID=29760 RepID=A0A438BLP0_VITVI|nr:hypothetical protein CK203_085649 [Vitis vinifera]
MLQTVHDSELKRRSYSHCKSITLKCCGISLLLREFAAFFVQCCGIPPEATRYMPQVGTLRTSRQVISVHGDSLVYPLRAFGRWFEGKSKVKDHLEWQVLGERYEPWQGASVINFVDYSLNQGAPAGHESAETPSRHESNGAVAGDRTPNQMVLCLSYLGLPLGAPNKALSVWDGMKERVKRRLTLWKRQYISKGSSKKVRKITKSLLWGRGNLEKKTHLVNWEVVCADKEKGGLGLRKIAFLNKALLGKWIWRFVCDKENLWNEVISVKYGQEGLGWRTNKANGHLE